MKKRNHAFTYVIRKFGSRNIAAAVFSIGFFVLLIISYFLLMFSFAKDSIIARGETNAVRAAGQFDSYIITEKLIVEQARYRLEQMMDEGATHDEILKYIVENTDYIRTSVNENVTGLYAYIKGEYYDGVLWEPGEGWIATERPWYTKTMENEGRLTLIEPYVDAQTDQVTMTVAQALSDGESVVAIDISFDMIRMITGEYIEGEDSKVEMVVDEQGDVMAHSDSSQLGHNFLEEKGTLGSEVVSRAFETDEKCFEMSFDGTDYVVYVIRLNDNWYCISLIDSAASYRPLKIILFVTLFVILVVVVILLMIFYNLSERSIAADRLNKQLSTTSDIYLWVLDIDVINDAYSSIKQTPNVKWIMEAERGGAQHVLSDAMMQLTWEGSREIIGEFINLATLEKRLDQMNTLTVDFMDYNRRWCRGRFLVSERIKDGTISHVLWLVESIDDEKRRRDELQDMSTRAIAASEAKSTFLSNMSHEIRTPINAIIGMNEMILRECGDKNILAYSDSIETASNTLLGIINDILDFSKIEAGKMEIIPVDYDLASVLNDLVNMIQTRIDEKGLVLKLDFDRNIPNLLHGDEVRLKQVITNILTNAAKYTEKGTVTFIVGYEEIKDKPDHIMMKVAVKDTGIGIRRSDMKKLFSEFDRIDEERNRNIEGTGLGMAITQSLLNLMGSSLEVESEYGRGSTFSFSLEQRVMSREAMGDYEEAYRHSVLDRQTYKEKFTARDARVLIVDDTRINLMVFKSLLKKTMIQIDTALSGDEGIAAATERKYDVIFLDHMMPHKDGIETLAELRGIKDNPNADTPVICLTANAISGAREQYLAAGFDDYLTKPIDTARLEEMLIRYLPEDKVDTVNFDEYQASEEPDISKLPDGFEIEGIDREVGIEQCGSEEDYLSILSIFSDTYVQKRDELQYLYDTQDMDNYTVKVHALKSSAFIIGADALGTKAKEMESAGKAGDIDHIRADHDNLMKDYDKIVQGIRKALEGYGTGKEPGGRTMADQAVIAAAYETIAAAAEDMDIAAIEDAIGELEDYALPDDVNLIIEQIKAKCTLVDYDGIIALLKDR